MEEGLAWACCRSGGRWRGEGREEVHGEAAAWGRERGGVQSNRVPNPQPLHLRRC